jgi:hypothetical protein
MSATVREILRGEYDRGTKDNNGDLIRLYDIYFFFNFGHSFLILRINKKTTVNHNYFIIYNKTNRRTDFPNLLLAKKMNLYMFRAVPLPIISSSITVHVALVYVIRSEVSLRAGPCS